jgi:C-terminal processing protease CtpA/Prc
MKRIVIISIFVFVAISFFVTTFAFAGEKKCCASGIATAQKKDIHVNSDGEDVYVYNDDGDGKIEIKKGGKGAYMGIYMEDLSEKAIEKNKYPKEIGVLITKIVEDSPAEEAGIKEDDIIFKLAGKEISSTEELSKAVKKHKPGDEIDVVLYRKGKKKTIGITLGEQPYEFFTFNTDEMKDYAMELGRHAGELGSSMNFWLKDNFGLKGRLGLHIMELDEDMAGYFDVKGGEGVLVLKVAEDSPAEEAGIKAGDVVTLVNGEGISEPEDLIDELCEFEEGEEVELTVVRKGKEQIFKIELEEDYLSQRIMVRPPRTVHKVRAPQWQHFDSPEVEVHVHEKEMVEQELKELKKELEKLEERLKELEKEKK